MFIFDISNLFTFILILVMTCLLIFLAQELKKSYIGVIPLVLFLGIISMHAIQLLTLSDDMKQFTSILFRCLAIDFVFILISFMGYLWVDDVDAKAHGKVSVDNSLDWFWKNV